MNQFKKIFFSGVLLSLCMLSTATAQINTGDSLGFHFNNSYLGARSVALADAQVANAANINAMYTNPATLPFSSTPVQLSGNSLYNADFGVMIQNLTAPVLVSENTFLGVGISFQHQNFIESAQTTTSTPRFNQYGLSVAYAAKLYPTLSIGTRIDIDYGTIDNSRDWASNASVGFLYAPSSAISYGLVYRGAGFNSNGIGSGLYYPTSSIGTTSIERYELPHRLELGAALRFPSEIDDPKFVLTFSNEKVFTESGLIYRGGLEVFAIPELSLRGGYFYNTPDNNGFRGGIGLNLPALDLSYSYAASNPEVMGQFHQLSISLNINNN